MRLITIPWLSIISMTIIADVMGDWVTAARKPTMQSAIIGCAATLKKVGGIRAHRSTYRQGWRKDTAGDTGK